MPNPPSDPIQDDLRNFLFLLWQFLGLPDPTETQYDIATYLQHGPTRRTVMAFRGVGKSFLTAGYAVWLLMRDPDHKIIVVSASAARSNAFSLFTKRIIEEFPLCQHLKARPGQRTSLEAFDVGPARIDQSPSVKSVGITGQITGSRADTIIADDVEVPSNSDTVGKREKLAELVKEFDAVLKPGGQVVYLGTAQTEESLYTKHLSTRGYQIRIWPARFPDEAQREKYGSRLAPSITDRIYRGAVVGTTVEPLRFTDADLAERELSYGRSGFALQFMLDTALSDAERYPLRLRDFVTMPLTPTLAPLKMAWGSSGDLAIEGLPLVGFSGDRYYRPFFVSKDWVDYSGCTMFIDPAGRGRDELAYAVVAHLHGNLFLLECKGLTGGYVESNLEILAREAKRLKVKLIRIEANFGDGMFEQLLKPVLSRIYPCTTEEIRSSKQKELRIIDTLEPVLNQHRLVIDEALIKRDAENYPGHALEKAHQFQLLWQLTHVTRDKGSLKHDDRLDALAGAVAYWIEQLDQDDTKSEETHRQELLERDIERFLGEVEQSKPSGTRWVSLW